jgi:polysaccharide export outer membrane protein
MRMSSRFAVYVAAALFSIAGASVVCAQTPAPSAAPAATKDDGYILGAGDVVEVEVLGRSDFKARIKVDVDGSIQLPFVGKTPVAGKTSMQIADQIGETLDKGGFYRKPIMRVEVVGFASRYVTVLGAVGNPGLVPVDRPYRLSEILARVGGVRENASDFVVLTPEGGQSSRLSIKDVATGNSSQDPVVQPGTKISVAQAELFFISGQVKIPGAYPVSEGMTLRMAIARGGGLTDIGTDRGVKVTHKDGRVEKPALESKISPNDVIVVGERLF